MENKKTLFGKILKGLITLGGFFGLISITDLRIPLNIWAIIVISLILIIIIWHGFEMYRKVLTYFKKLEENINFIKKRVSKKRRQK